MLRGVSRSGKSTLLSIIGGIEPVISGQVVIDGQDVDKLKKVKLGQTSIDIQGGVYISRVLSPTATDDCRKYCFDGDFCGDASERA